MARLGKPRVPQALASIVYRSLASVDLQDADLLALLARARTRNQATAVTGLLVYDLGCFFQCLEGSEASLTRVMNRIRQDPHHTDIEILVHESLPQRVFPGWSMNLARRAAAPSWASRASLPAAVDAFDGLYRSDAAVWQVLASLRGASWQGT